MKTKSRNTHKTSIEKTSDNDQCFVALQWPRLGPYHLARVKGAKAFLRDKGFKVVGLEIAGDDSTYGWQKSYVEDLKTIFPQYIYEEIPLIRLWRGIYTHMNALNPDVVAISGYSSSAAQILLSWCRLHHRPAILMSESKADDVVRSGWREWLKGKIVGQYDAALCGGRPHAAYLQQLGMRRDQIALGYDAVDNEYFWQAAERVRRSPEQVRSLPGLADSTPFFLASSRFIPRKNLTGLIRAYGRYRQLMRRRQNAAAPWRLVILGDGEERSTLEHLIKTQRIEGVSLAGFRQIDKLPAYYGLAGLFIHPALQEQWGLVVNEAMASGLPVLVSERCGCAPDLVHNGENGYTFDPENGQQLAQLMVAGSTGRFDLGAMAAASRRIIADWGPQRFAEGMYQAVQMALGEKRT